MRYHIYFITMLLLKFLQCNWLIFCDSISDILYKLSLLLALYFYYCFSTGGSELNIIGVLISIFVLPLPLSKLGLRVKAYVRAAVQSFGDDKT